MTLWLALALMTMAAVFIVLWPLGRGGWAYRSGGEVAVYKDQLSEIARDRVAGLIGAPEAEAARVEVSRRLLHAADVDAAEDVAEAVGDAPWRRRFVAIAALIMLPLGAGGLYLVLGSPDLPAQPVAARLDAPIQKRSIEVLVAQAEQHLESNPEDGRGWQILAPVYMRLGRFDDAAKALRNALRLTGDSAEGEADLGEALVGAANGVVTVEAAATFDRALKLDADNVKARFFSGMSAEQDGRRERAAAIWRDLLRDAPAGAPWVGFVREALAHVDPDAGANVSAADPGLPAGPRSEDIAAAANLAPEQRSDMVRGMVARLAERLAQDGSDIDGWLRLVRSYMVLGEREKAQSAVSDARRALGNDPDKLRRIEELVKGLGLDG